MRRVLPLCALLFALGTVPTSAILDENANGLSDVWEKKYNAGNLFSTGFDPLDDPDADGWTNEQEAAAGADPFDPNPPDGFIRPQITHIPEVLGVTPEAIQVTWPQIPGKLYTLLCSPDLAEWLSVEGWTLIGDDTAAEYIITLPQDDKLFWRVKVEDIDSDGDGLTNAEEYELGTDPMQRQTLTGYPDLWLAQHYFSILMNGGINTIDPDGDPDDDGLTNAQENVLGTDPNDSDDNDISQESITNGGFSAPTIGMGLLNDPNDHTWDYWAGITGWSATEGQNIEIQNIEPIEEGDPYVELKAHPEDHYGIKQQVGTRIGATYILILDCKARQDTTLANNNFLVKVDGNLILAIAPSSTWSTRAMTFTATDVIAEISLEPDTEPNDTMGCLVDNVRISPVEVVDKSMNPASELKVAKLTDSGVLSGNGTLNPDNDADRFYIRISGAASLGATTVKIGTISNPDSDYNDEQTEIDLTSDDGDLVSKSLLLVSDDVDDDFQVDNIADNSKNDRTFKVQLAGKLKISAIKVGEKAEQSLDKRVPVNIKKTVNVKMVNCQWGIIFYDPCWDDSLVTEIKKVLKERYAQVGVKLNITNVSGPHIGFTGWVDNYPTLIDGVINIPAETKEILDALPNPSGNEVTVYLVSRLGGSGQLSSGSSLPPKYLNASDTAAGYGNRVFVGNYYVGYAKKFTAPHELLHILLDAQHSDYTTDDQMLFKAPTSEVDTIDATKRIPGTQEEKIHSNTLAQ